MKSFSLFLFSLVRVVMLVILSGYFLQMTDGIKDLRTFYIIVAIPIFITSHFIQMANVREKTRILCSSIDFIVITGFGFSFYESGYLYLIFFGVLSTTVFLLYDRKKLLGLFSGAFFALWILISLRLYAQTGIFSVSSNIVNGMFVFYGAFVGGLIRNFHSAKETIASQYEQLNDSHGALQTAHRQLKDYSQQVEQLTVIRERNEIAREIHDTVGHKMTALIVQLQVAGEMAERDPKKAKEVLNICEQLSREALHELRVSVRTLKEDFDGQSFQDDLEGLLKEFSAMTHMKTWLDSDGNISSIPKSLQPTIKRIVQEGLTNAKKHGNADTCIVKIHMDEKEIRVLIKDDGKGKKNIIPNFGLINMKERVAEHGGSFEIESVEGEGFGIMITFPLQRISAGVTG
ncbi:ATP-binding protein [Sporosarcina highlanderae]|uniref:histidine kinase n=1 Tax=Sporosarcina highlanderae TaxID=3035916 RepID=A0ABT8JUP0_9BACL|nr:sensor histidine kinase [Sporosarcina highlanderae]MDN4608885.1 sensor histidine kinase [Sporosarcina highlanderae]